MDNLDRMDKFLETYNLPQLNQEKSKNLNGQISTTEIEVVIIIIIIKTSQHRKVLDRMASQKKFINIKEELTPILLKLFQKIQEEGTLPSSFYEARKQMKTLQRKKIIGQYP